jgi:hypothetical protein
MYVDSSRYELWSSIFLLFLSLSFASFNLWVVSLLRVALLPKFSSVLDTVSGYSTWLIGGSKHADVQRDGM